MMHSSPSGAQGETQPHLPNDHLFSLSGSVLVLSLPLLYEQWKILILSCCVFFACNKLTSDLRHCSLLLVLTPCFLR